MDYTEYNDYQRRYGINDSFENAQAIEVLLPDPPPIIAGSLRSDVEKYVNFLKRKTFLPCLVLIWKDDDNSPNVWGMLQNNHVVSMYDATINKGCTIYLPLRTPLVSGSLANALQKVGKQTDETQSEYVYRVSNSGFDSVL